MLRLRDIMTTDLATVGPETTLRQAVELFATRHLSGAPVVDGDHVVGVVSTSDILEFLASAPPVPAGRDGADVPLEAEAEEEAPDWKADELPAAEFFTDMWPDDGAETLARFASPASPEWDVLDEHEVSEVMTRAPLTTLPPTAGVEWAADLMRRQRIHRILITDDEALVGIVSALDIVTAVADHRLTARHFVFNAAPSFPDG